MPKAHDLTEKKFGKLTVMRFSYRDTKSHQAFWECQCECGGVAIVNGSNLVRGYTKSCGCLKGENHGGKHEPLYKIWRGIKQRCNLPTNPAYKYYGGRGIKVCNEWLESYATFREWALISGGYGEGLTIDRIDNNKLERGYSPENCRFVPEEMQNRNKRNNIYLTLNGETMLLVNWANKLGISCNTLRKRIYYSKWPLEKALTLGRSREIQTLRYAGQEKSIYEWSQSTGISAATIHSRLKLGWGVERILTTPIDEKYRRVVNKLYTVLGETNTLAYFCKKYDKVYRTVRTRINRGWSIEDALTKPVKEISQEWRANAGI